MRFTSRAGALAACLFSGLIVSGYAQHDEKQVEKQGGRPPEQRPQPAQQHARQSQRQESAPQAQQPRPQRAQQAPQGVQAPGQEPQAQPQQQQRQPQAQQQPQRTQQAPQQQRTQAPPQRAQQQQQQSRQQQQQPQTQQRSVLSQTQQQPQRSREQAQSWQQQRGWLKQGGGWQGHDTFQQDASRNWASDHRSWAQRGGYGGYYIPQYSFNLYFGRQHFFRLGALPVMYLGYPRFDYEGTSFLLLDPWPQNWSQDWYASDDVYIDYDDGYYLYDRNYPQQRLAITILV